MSRIRTIKPEFWSSPGIETLAPEWRLLFIAMWNWCDDYGRGTAEPRELMGFAFPRDEDLTVVGFRRGLGEVRRVFGVVFYRVAGRSYYAIPSWEKHQKIDKRAKGSRYPSPEDGEVFNPASVQVDATFAIPSAFSAESSMGSAESSTGSGVGTGEQGNRGTGEQGKEKDIVPSPSAEATACPPDASGVSLSVVESVGADDDAVASDAGADVVSAAEGDRGDAAAGGESGSGSKKARNNYPPEFEQFWKAYPRTRGGNKGKTCQLWRKAVAEVGAPELLARAEWYARNHGASSEQFIKLPETFMAAGEGGPWRSIDPSDPDIVMETFDVSAGSAPRASWDDVLDGMSGGYPGGISGEYSEGGFLDAEVVDAEPVAPWESRAIGGGF